jgi:hypothetical protein
MTDEPDNHTLRLLRRIDQNVAALRLEFSDPRDAVHRVEAELGAVRGTVAALRHDASIYANRWSDIEVRMRAVEEANGK